MTEYQSMPANLGRHALELAQQEWGKPQPLNQAFSELVSDESKICSTTGQWYVVSIEHQQGNLAKGEIAARGMVPYLPMVPQSERHGRGMDRVMWRPMLGLYMFVQCMAAQWPMVMAARGVRRFIGRNGRPEPIDEQSIEVVRLVEAERTEAERQRVELEVAKAKARANGRSGIIWQFAEGDRVRIKNGPFAGFYADLTAAVDVHDRIRAFVSLFGAKPIVELSAFDIEKAV